jgi:hypothetical protein
MTRARARRREVATFVWQGRCAAITNSQVPNELLQVQLQRCCGINVARRRILWRSWLFLEKVEATGDTRLLLYADKSSASRLQEKGRNEVSWKLDSSPAIKLPISFTGSTTRTSNYCLCCGYGTLITPELQDGEQETNRESVAVQRRQN